jgi:hypothetical protein
MDWLCFCTGGIMADTKVGNGSNNYIERQSVQVGEELFLSWAKTKGYHVTRIGFDSTNDSVPNFFKLSPLLRNMPDYVLNTDKKTYVVNVKGTANIKHKEIKMLGDLMLCYSSSSAELIYAFCFAGQEPVLMSTTTLSTRFNMAEDKQWHDGVKYRTIKI